jgi:hypothetical protein
VTSEAATRRHVTISVDEVTVILALLGVLCEERDPSDDIADLANRTVARLRERLANLSE